MVETECFRGPRNCPDLSDDEGLEDVHLEGEALARVSVDLRKRGLEQLHDDGALRRVAVVQPTLRGGEARGQGLQKCDDFKENRPSSVSMGKRRQQERRQHDTNCLRIRNHC